MTSGCYRHRRKEARNRALVRDYWAGLRKVDLARKYGISAQRVRVVIMEYEWEFQLELEAERR